MNDTDTPDTPTDRRPLGFWLRTVDALITREFADAFADEGVTRRDWMLLNTLAGDVDTTWLTERLAGKGKRLRRLEDLGWVEERGDGTWTLTDAGREAKERLGTIVDGIRERVSGAVAPDDFATTMASLEAIARELGWDESMRMPRPGRPRFGRGFGPGRGFAPGFGPGRGFGPGFFRGFESDHEHPHHEHPHHEHPHHEHPHHEHPHHDGHARHRHGRGEHCPGEHRHGEHGRRHARRHAEHAYERGFDAGFDRGRHPHDD